MDTFEGFAALLGSWFEMHSLPKHLQEQLYKKLRDEVFDAGAFFSLAALAEEEGEEEEDAEGDGEEAPQPKPEEGSTYVLVSTTDVVAKNDIWLVDHCCTFKLREFRSHLEENEALRARLGGILALKLSHTNAKEDAQKIFDHMWKKVGSYRLPGSSDEGDSQYDSTWYIHDEVGSAITVVTDVPGNMKLETLPILFPKRGGGYSVIWCVEDMEAGTIATRKVETVLEAVGGQEVVTLLYGPGEEGGEEEEKKAYLDAKCACVEAWWRFVGKLEAVSLTSGAAPGQSHPTLPVVDKSELPLRVFTDSKLVSEYLTDASEFLLVDLPQEAHVVWISHDPIEDLGAYRHAQFISQFPEERIFTSKQGLLHLVQENFGYADWYQVSYDSTSQLREFIGDFMVRQERLEANAGKDSAVVANERFQHLRHSDGTNLWITKPANMARSIDMTVSPNLDALLKAMETGPKTVCKYIANSATLRQRKFDLRFIVAVRSFVAEHTPMEAYVYNVFWTRFALEDYTLDEFDRYEKHWTVMNYANPEKLLQLHDRDFILEFNEECAAKGCGPSAWEQVVYPKILAMLRDAFGMIRMNGASHDRCRAIYGVDVMLRESPAGPQGAKTFEPSLLEITYSPDCQRACKFHPEFFNDVFRTLFLGKPTGVTRL
ncbi:putative tubulin tyrosine ligase [Trypanosoma grayi]|uniref:putative tubulin tyrosine ligase n=1 Tax=Trypanosoma grayi TaxID=71804 RepID=UPI0004F4945D|nr:putative tubulin tyrosine ligase [Trypanosoma grayi]KEG13702.1 putative tubulin tyrosine ligase [Trypanosoma grayi]